MTKAKKLRELFKKQGFFRLIGAHNGLTARLGERTGFDGIWASSLEVSASHAVPDANILTMTDYLNAAIDMNEAVSIPVVVDVDQGYGNSTNVVRMVKKFEETGIAGVIMEDKLFPKQNSLLADGRQELASIAEFVGKIMAAKNAQKTKDFMVMARTEALIAGWGQKEAMKRAKAYVEAGADAIMIHSKKKDPKDIIDFVNSWKENIPLVIIPSTYYTFTEDKIKKYPQIKMVVYANQGVRTIVKSVTETFKEIIKGGGTHTVVPKIASVRDVFELQGTFEMKSDEEKFLKTGKEPITTIIPAAGDDSYIPSFKDLVQDRPLTMLDINGKPILTRISEHLLKAGITDINVVTGYKADKINVENIKIIENKEYAKKGILHSIMSAKDKMNGKVLITFADILFDEDLIQKVIRWADNDINIVIDSSYKGSGKKKTGINLVVAKHDPIKGDRIMKRERSNPILKAGGEELKKEANYEFFGTVLLSKKGTEIFKSEYESLLKNPPKGKFYNAESFDKAEVTDFFQYLIDKGIRLDSIEVHKGWMEIHTFDDYKRACHILAE